MTAAFYGIVQSRRNIGCATFFVSCILIPMPHRVLCVTAHPDDEAGNFGGTLAKLAAGGARIHLICLTGGEAARNRGEARSNQELIQLRTAELAAACRILDIYHHEVWDLPDAGLKRANFYVIASRLALVIRRLRPHVLFTFGPEGSLTAHPDHAMAGLLATAAFHWAGSTRYLAEDTDANQANAPQPPPPYACPRLFHATGLQSPPGLPVVLPGPPDLICDVRPYIERKRTAFHCHQTQAPLFPRVDAYLAGGNGYEFFHLAAAPLGFDRRRLESGDPFAGLTAD